jgi:cytoskeleton protein RodZ
VSEPSAPGPDEVVAPVPTAGDQLRAARESHGLSIDTVAQHLKLAPRQVRALEDGDYQQLPGRTFTRGFARNYARLMQLDADAIVAALPDAQQAPALDTTPLAASARAIGEMPVSQRPRGIAWSRWALLLAIIALAIVAAIYETNRSRETDKAASARRMPADPIGPSTPIGTPLQNPLVASDASTASSAAASTAATGVEPQPAEAPSPTPAAASTSLPITSAQAVAEATLVISYRGPAWTEVRDASDQRLLLVTGTPGAKETVTGTPPFDLTLGNASNATISWRGAAFDLAPHTKGNVARVRLP